MQNINYAEINVDPRKLTPHLQEDSDRHQQQQDASEDHGGSDMGGGGGGGGGGPKTCGKCIQEECAAPVSCLAGTTNLTCA